MLLLVASIPMNVFGATTLAITTQPTSQTIVEGKTVTFSVVATGATSYQWQTYNNSKWTNLSWTGATTNKMTFTSDAKYSGKKFRCVISDGKNKIATDTVVFKVLSIKTQPTTQYVIEGKTVTFSVDAPGAATYQWQTYNNSKWTNLSWTGATTNKMTFTSAPKYSGKKFRCVISDGKNKIATDTVVFRTLSIKTQPTSQSVVEGETVTLSIDAPGAASYQWQTYNGAKWANLSWTGANTSQLKFVSDWKYNGKKFRCVVKDSAGNSLASNEAEFFVLGYTITYDAGDGRFESGLRYEYSVENPGVCELGPKKQNGDIMIPELDGYIFVGWKYYGRLTQQVNLTDDIYVEAEWAEACSIRYNLNGGHLSDETASMAAGMGYTMDGNVLKETVAPGTYFIPGWIEPQKEGYFFKGWKYGSAYMRSATVNGTRNTIELMADWEEAALVTYDANGGYWLFDEEEGSFDKVSFYQPKGTYYLGWHEPIKEGYYFYGWLDASGRNKVKVNLTGDSVYKAYWHPKYNVTYHGNGGQFDAEEFHDDRNYYVGDLCNYYGDNYECISDVIVNGPTAWDATKWQKIDKIEDVVREERGGNYHVGSVEEPYREGYVFLGWSGIASAPRGEMGWDIPLQADMEFYAIWAKENIIITFDSNGGYIPQGEGNEYQEFDTIDFDYDPWQGLDIIMADRMEREEYDFLGWSEQANATKATYFHNQRAYFEDSTTLYAVWEKKAVITFDANGGCWSWEEWVNGENGQEGHNETRTKIKEVDYRHYGEFYYVRTGCPELEGFEFGGWLDEQGNLMEDNEPILLQSDRTFRANWIKKISVTYNANGGSWYDEHENRYFDTDVWEGNVGEVHIGWASPNRDGYKFVGWSLDPNADPATGEIEYEFNVELDSNKTYYAIWSEPFTVTYNANGGIFNYDDSNNPVTVNCADNIWYGDYELWDRFDRQGYDFLGWSTTSDATEAEYGPRDHIDIKGATTFYATWKKCNWITYDANGGQWGDENNPEFIRLDWRGNVEYYYVGWEAPWRDGYDFEGWVDVDGHNADNREIQTDKDYTFQASWKRRIKVTYDGNGGQFFDEHGPVGKELIRDARSNEEYGLEGWEPRKDGCWFVGWADKEYPTVEDIIDNPVVFDDSKAEITLYAVWAKAVDITYDFNGGTWDDKDDETWRDCRVLSTFDVGFEWPYREGYEFLGWSDNPDATDAEPNYTCTLANMDSYQDYDNANATVTFYAIWDRKAVVTFDAGDGQFRNGNNEISQYFRIGDIVDWDRDFGTEGDENIRPELDGFMFAGWTYYDADLDTYQEFRYQPITGDITLYAKWIELNTVTLNSNGGIVWDEEGNSGEVINITENVDCTLLASSFVPVREGYEFLGWFDANDELVNYITFTDDYTLTAKWAGEGEEDPHEHYGWGVTDIVITPNKTTVEVGEAFQIDHSATGVGYTFTWYRSTDQQNWTAVNEGDYWIEEILYTPGTYYYQLQIDNEESNIISVTVVE